MKVVHIISRISREGGGPSRSSQALVAALNAAGCETWLLSCHEGDVTWVEGVTHFAAPQVGERLKDFFMRQFAAVKPNVVHLHGIWDWQIHLAGKAARSLGIPYVVAPRGMLEPWSLAHKKWKKRFAMALYQRNDLKNAAALHATAHREAEQFRRLGFTQMIIESSNGVIVPRRDGMLHLGNTNNHGSRRVLFVSRMHEKKGVLELIEAWARVKPQDWRCELVYTLNGEEEQVYESKVKARIKELGVETQFILTGPLNDDAKWAAYARADLFVLPTYSENFGIVVTEALWAGVPVITTKGTPWQELEECHCGWWIDLPPKESLDAALREAMALPRELLRTMGVRGRRLIEEKYTWKAVCEAMVEGYQRIVTENGRGM